MARPLANSNINGIAGTLTLETAGGSDTLNIDNSGDTANRPDNSIRPNSLTATSFYDSALSTSVPVTYAGVENLLIWLGMGNDQFWVARHESGHNYDFERRQ